MEKSLEAEVGVWLKRRGLSLVTAESCTGGLMGDWITNVPGSSDYYLGSLVSYANEAKQHWLGVRPETLATYGAVSRETALEMARGARHGLTPEVSPARLAALAVSGVAGPGGGTVDKPVGLVWIGLSAPDLERAWCFHWQGNRIENKIASAREALRLLLEYLHGTPREES